MDSANQYFRCLRTYKDFLLRRARRINIAVTYQCNMRCEPCGIWRLYRDHPERAEKEIGLQQYMEFFRRNDGWNWVSVTGGEPFTRSDLYDILWLAVKCCPRLHTVSVPTNGFYVDMVECTVHKMLRLPLPSLYVSVNPCNDRSMETFHMLRRIGNRRFKVHVELVVASGSTPLKDRMDMLGLERGDVIVTFAQNSYYYNNQQEDVVPPHYKVLEEVGWFLNGYKARSLHDLAQKTFLQYVLKQKPIRCISGTYSFFLDPYGNVHPCILRNSVVGSVWCRLNGKAVKGCNCYTPCESYFHLLMGAPWNLALR